MVNGLRYTNGLATSSTGQTTARGQWTSGTQLNRALYAIGTFTTSCRQQIRSKACNYWLTPPCLCMDGLWDFLLQTLATPAKRRRRGDDGASPTSTQSTQGSKVSRFLHQPHCRAEDRTSLHFHQHFGMSVQLADRHVCLAFLLQPPERHLYITCVWLGSGL